jgi:Flp pilus assembly protein TadD
MAAMKAALLGILGSLAMALASCGGAAPAPAHAASAASSEPSLEDSDAKAQSSAQAPPSAELLAGVKAFDAGSYPEARASFAAAIKKNPNDFEALYDLGMVSEKMQDKAAAESAYKSALALKPDLEAAPIALSALYLDEGRTDEALAVARAGLAKHPGSAPLHENLGIAMAARGNQDDGLNEFQRALQITPTEPMFHLTLAHWLNVWHVRGAKPHLDAAREMAKDDYAMLASVGFEYRMAGEFDACVKTFDRAIVIKDGGEVRTERALCRHGLNDDKGTFDDLQAAVTKDPSYAAAHYYLGGQLARARRFKEAATEYTKYLELEPTGSLAKPAGERLKAVTEAMGKERGGVKRN